MRLAMISESQAIPEGYKQTEVGVIPEDWEIKKLREISPSQSVGLVINPSSYYSSNGTVPMLVGSHVFENKIKWEKANKITVESNTRLPASRLKAGDLVTVRVGDPGVTAVVPLELDQSNCASMMIIRQGSKFDSHWLCFLMNSKIGRSRVEGVQYGTAQKQFNIIDAVDFLFPFPKKEEQIAIANALSDVGTLLSELEKLIAKKQTIKIATMQQLLTGKNRLPQFASHTEGAQKGQPKGMKPSELGEIPEDWEVLSIDECSVKVGSGKTPTGGSSVYVDSGRPFVRSQNVGWGELRLSDLSYITEQIHSTFTGSEIKLNDVLLNITGASIGRCALATERVERGNVNQHVCIIRLIPEKVSPYILQTLINSDLGQNQIDSYQAGGNREGLNFSQVKNLKFPLPSNSEEQSAIATIFSDMDEEIQALKKRLAKTRQIKQGMMQELLTGRTRLPFDKAETQGLES